MKHFKTKDHWAFYITYAKMKSDKDSSMPSNIAFARQKNY